MKKIITSLLLLTILNVKSQTISLDTSFGTNGFTSIPLVGEGDDLQIQISQDNKILATGKDLPISTSINPNKVYKLNLDGTLDTSFGNLGTLILPNYSGDFKAVLQGSDKFLIVFQSVSSTAPNFRSILRYNSNGTLDTSFGTNGETQIPFSGSTGFRFNNLVVLSDNSMIIADGVKYTKLTSNGILDSTYGTSGVINQTNSANIQNQGSNLLNFYYSKIENTTTNAVLVNSFGSAGTFNYPISSDYFSKQTLSGNINSLDLNSNKFYNVSSSGTLLNTINLTNDGNTLDYYIDVIFDNNKYFFVGTSTTSKPFIVSYDSNGILIPLNGSYSYKENAISSGNATSILSLNNEIYIGGDKVDSSNKWFYTISKYNFSTLGTNDIKTENSISFENPIKSNLNFHTKEKISKIEIYSSNGQLVKKVTSNSTNVSNLTSGVYLLKTTFQNGKSMISKVIKR